MTKQASFKRRVRERMAKTGERYAAARKALLNKADTQTEGRPWVANPEISDQTVIEKTGRSWNQWCDYIDAHVNSMVHAEIAAYLFENTELNQWWSQGITVGYERVTGLRQVGQLPDGTFTANKSKTLPINADLLRKMLVDDTDRDDLFAGDVPLLSKPTAKALRLQMKQGVAIVSVTDKGDRCTVSVQHTKLPAATDIAEAKHYWSEWFDAVTEATAELDS